MATLSNLVAGAKRSPQVASRDGGRNWSANQVICRSPDGTVCECCNVSITAKDNDVYVQFHNWLDGSRNLYLAHSTDSGKTYATAQKLGMGNWKLAACPMDGGTVVLSASGQPLITWRRENTLYTYLSGEPEKPITTGRNARFGHWQTRAGFSELITRQIPMEYEAQ